MLATGTFKVIKPTDRELVMTHTFDAPPSVVFDAWTNAEHVRHWWDPSGVPLNACEIDLRPNGIFRWVNTAHGGGHVFTGIYHEISRPERLVFAVKSFPSRPDPLTTLTFVEDNGKTKFTMRIQCDSKEDRDALLQMRIDVGTGMTLGNLANYLNHSNQRAEGLR